VILVDIAAVLTLGAAGIAGAWLMRRRTTLAVKNLYLAAVIAVSAAAAAAAARWWAGVVVLVAGCSPLLAGAIAARRWRLTDLGAGEELR